MSAPDVDRTAISPSDRAVLRDLAKRVAEIAALPVMAERRALWKEHNSLRPVRPMILIFPEGAWCELLPWSSLVCESDRARSMEFDLRHRIYGYEHFRSDNVVEGEWIVGKAISDTGWGLEAQHRPSDAERGAWAFSPVINTPEDMRRLHFPEVVVDEAASARNLEQAHDLFGDILRVRQKGVSHISFHLMNHYTGLRGLEQTMTDMVDNPGWLHDAMAFLTEGYRRLVQQYIDLNLLSQNNDNTYHSSGGNGYTDELPAPGFDPDRVRPCDMWASAESQELAQVSPRMHAEFALAYEKQLLEPFGLNGYGCCEDLTRKLDDVLTIPRIRRISVAPSADVQACARQLGNRAILSWKPNPATLVGETSDEYLRAYIGNGIAAARENGCVLEIILKDTHTCEWHPERFDRWTEIAWELVNEA